MAAAQLADKRLNARLGRLLSDLGERPAASIPAACGGYKEMTAAYRFFDNPKVTYAKVLAPHQASTRRRMAAQPVVLLVQDTTEMNLTRPQQQVEGAGPLDGGARRMAVGVGGDPTRPVAPRTAPFGRDDPSGRPTGRLRESAEPCGSARPPDSLAGSATDARSGVGMEYLWPRSHRGPQRCVEQRGPRPRIVASATTLSLLFTGTGGRISWKGDEANEFDRGAQDRHSAETTHNFRVDGIPSLKGYGHADPGNRVQIHAGPSTRPGWGSFSGEAPSGGRANDREPSSQMLLPSSDGAAMCVSSDAAASVTGREGNRRRGTSPGNSRRHVRSARTGPRRQTGRRAGTDASARSAPTC